MNDENETIYVNGILSNRHARIVITSPQPGDKKYAEDVVEIWNKESAFMLRGNMKIELMEPIVFIKVIDPSPNDCEYIRMLLKNWNNYYKPENYLLSNTTIINNVGSNWIIDTPTPRKDLTSTVNKFLEQREYELE